jgi:MFS family permease
MTASDAPALSRSSRERIYRRNFIYFLADNISWNVGMGIVGAATVIPDFVRHLTASEILIGLSGSLPVIGHALPQLLVARYIVRHARKKWWFVGPNIPARSMLLIFAALTLWFGRGRPGLILPAFFICYGIASFANGLVGVPWADLAGTSLDNRWRARVLGLTTAATGLLMLGLAPLIGVVLSDRGPAFPDNYAVLFGAAGVLLAIGILPGVFFEELPGGKAVDRLPAIGEFLPDLGRVLRDDGPFRAFSITRVLISLFMMATPFYVGYATVQLGLSSAVAVPVLLAMQTAGSLAGAFAYTWLGTRSNLWSIRLALGGLALTPACALLAGMLGPLPLYFGFLVSGLAASIWDAGYLNWIVGYAPPEQRPNYVGLSNTLAGVSSLVAPFVGGAIAQTVGYSPLFVVSLALALAALFVALRSLRDARMDHARA